MRTLVYGAVVALLTFACSMAFLSWTGSTAEPEAAQAAANAVFETAQRQEICHAENLIGADMPTTMEAGMTHNHPLREVAAGLPVPTITHLVFPDEMDGYNVQVLTENFTFTPSAINKDVVENKGHAHLYINGEKISRVYGNWVHIPSNLLVAGANAVSVTLNANDHSEWAKDGKSIGSTVIVVKPESGASNSSE
ncbi:hypothetical protein ACGYLX_15855 [Sulfitobacter sp. 1A13496]|uniref:hypothetical protein n=1 Tax=Sulfitobacter sp. 1A13496 TaxID=3368596 RepID=UPI0037465487